MNTTLKNRHRETSQLTSTIFSVFFALLAEAFYSILFIIYFKFLRLLTASLARLYF